MRFGIFDKFGALNSQPVFRAFRQGLDRLAISYRSHDESADVAVIWSVLWSDRMMANRDVWQKFRDSQRPVIVLEVGSLFRGRTWKMAINGTTGSAKWGQGIDPRRPHDLGLVLAPWRPKGQHVVIACQRTQSHQWQGQPPVDQWLDRVISEIRQHSDREIRVRPHPRQKITAVSGVRIEPPMKLQGTYDDFDFARSIENAWCVVNWNSAPGIQAIIKGIPAVVSPDSLAAPVALTDLSKIESPLRPDRESWLESLSHTEWTTDEITSGHPIQRLLLDL